MGSEEAGCETQMIDSEPQTNPSGESSVETASERRLRILARAVHRALRAEGHDHGDIIDFANEVLDLVTSQMQRERESKI